MLKSECYDSGVLNNMNNMNNNKVKIVEPNKGKHMAVAAQINTIVASKEDTGGTYSFIECRVFPGVGPVPHIQTREHEAFYLVEGQLTFTVDKERIEAKAGTFINVPPNILHTFKNETDEIAVFGFQLLHKILVTE
jgi:quercetin dioxygenase-like cupin family protein